MAVLDDSAPDDDIVGQRIGKYELLGRLARGGMAELFVGRVTGEQGFEKVVAIKRILPHLADDADFVEMFLAEARLAATLEHPNVVPVYDFGKAGRDYYFAMPYIQGKDLLQILRKSQQEHLPLPRAQAIGIAAGIAAGLHYTHNQVGFDGVPLDIVHRDVSPANVLITFGGHVKVVDFGIAKASAQTSVTKVGVRKGKAAYMSPEQVRGDPVDRRSDVFSLGIVLWEMLTQRRLFRGADDLAIMHRIVSGPAPPPSSAAADIPPELDAILARCLNPDVDARYPTAGALQQDLERFASAQRLSTASAGMAEYFVKLFGPLEPAWTSQRMRRLTDEPSAPHRAEGTSLTRRPSETVDQDSIELEIELTRPKPMRGALLGAGLGLALAGVWWLAVPGPDAEPAPAADPASPAPAAAAADRDLGDLLNLVNQPDWTLALDYESRHAVLARVAQDTAVSQAVDQRLTVALDLVQAGQSPAPCDTYAIALTAIETEPDAYFLKALSAAPPPTGTTACQGNLGRRRMTLLDAMEPEPEPEPAVVPEPIEPPPAAVKPKRRPTKKKKKKKPAAPTSSNGLRPFGG